MRIGLVLPSSPGYSETFFKNKIKFLTDAGFEIIVFADNKGGKNDKRIDVVFLNFKGKTFVTQLLSTLRAVLRIMFSPMVSVRLLKNNLTDGFGWKDSLRSLLLSSHIISSKLDWLHFGFATMALRRENLAKSIGAKMAVSLRGFDISIYPIKYPGCYSQLWKRIDKLHYISDDILRLAFQQGLDRNTPAFKITPAIDFAAIQKRNSTIKQVPLILTTARLHWIKGLEETIEALAVLKRKGYDFRYEIIGDGPDRERLIFATEQLGLKSNVVFCGKLSHSEVFEKLSEADLYIQYSLNEGFCNSALEAQAAGVFCIVSDAEGLSENVLNEQTGLIIEKRNPEKLAKAIIRVFEMDVDVKKQIIDLAVERVKNQFEIRDQTKRFIEFYSKD